MSMPTLEEVDARLQTIEAKAVVYSEALRTIFRVMASDHMDRRALWKEGESTCGGLVKAFDPDALTIQVLRDDSSNLAWVDVFKIEGFV